MIVTTTNGTSAVSPADQFTFILAPPLPPSSFKGRVIENKFLSQTEYIHHLSWKPSKDSSVVVYILSRNGRVIAKIPATGPFVFNDPNRKKNKKDHYKLVAVDANGTKSQSVKLTLP